MVWFVINYVMLEMGYSGFRGQSGFPLAIRTIAKRELAWTFAKIEWLMFAGLANVRSIEINDKVTEICFHICTVCEYCYIYTIKLESKYT